ncbi:MAG: transposase [Trebonia sp.]
MQPERSLIEYPLESSRRPGIFLAHAGRRRERASLLRAIDLLDAGLRDLQGRVTARLAAIPGSWGVDAGGVTGPEAGRAAEDMSRFPTPEALVSWAGLTPAARQSGPRSGRGRRDTAALTPSGSQSWLPTPPRTRTRSWASASAASLRVPAGRVEESRMRGGPVHPRYRLAPAERPVARYRDLGTDWHARHADRSRKARNARRQLEALGCDVIITLREDAA